MSYCSRCGVEVEDSVSSCALCGTKIMLPDAAVAAEPERCYPPSRPACQARQRGRRLLTWEVWTALLSAAASAILAIDLLQNRDLSWSVYPLVSIGAVWVYINIALFLNHRPWLATMGLIGATMSFLGAIDLIGGSLSWFVPLGLPLTLLAGGAMMLTLLVRKRLNGGRLITATLLVLYALMCMAIDFTIGRFLGHPGIGWSIVVAAAIMPLELLLALDAVYLRKRFDLRCYFHL